MPSGHKKETLLCSRMNKTRRARRGGGIGNVMTRAARAVGLAKKSPLSSTRTILPAEKTLKKQIENLNQGIRGIEGLGAFEGFNVTNAVKPLKKNLANLKTKLAGLQGVNLTINQVNPGFLKGGKKTRRRRMTRRRR